MEEVTEEKLSGDFMNWVSVASKSQFDILTGLLTSGLFLYTVF